MNEINRGAIVILAALAIIVMAVIIFIAWAAPDETIDRFGDFAQYLTAHNDNPSKLIITLGALTIIVLAGLAIVVEVAPQERGGELRLEQAGATTIVSSQGLSQRLEVALLALPAITAAKVEVASRSKGVATSLDLTLAPGSNVAHASQEATRVVNEVLQEEMGLPVADPPRIRVAVSPAPLPGAVPSTAQTAEAPPEPMQTAAAPETASPQPPASPPSAEGQANPDPKADAQSQ